VGVFGDGYVDRQESAESWVGEGEEIVMGVGDSGKAKLDQMREQKREDMYMPRGQEGRGMERVSHWQSSSSWLLNHFM
jgi:hypothetical protein